MPLGYWWSVALVSWGVACALTRWRRLGSFSAIPAVVVNEMPFIVGYLLIASTVLALVDGDLDSPGGAVGAAVALLALAGLTVIVCRALRADAALRNSGKPRRPWGRILRAPFFPGRPDVVRLRGLAYGAGPDRTLDVYHRRDRPAGAPILLHFHGGWFRSGNKAREARPLIRHLTSRCGFVCVSADYRLQPRVTLADQVADVREAIAWVRAHAAEHGADPGRLFVTGSSAGAHLAVRALCEGETGIAERVRAVSRHPVIYAELPGAHHDFDLYESIRSAAVNRAVEQFTARITQATESSRTRPRSAGHPGTPGM